MARRVFFSFHYQDVIDFRANVVRNHSVTKDDNAGYFDASIWESAKKQGDTALKRLINGELDNTSVTAVLIGSQTYARRWVRYEIVKSIERGNKVLGIHINGIPDIFACAQENGWRYVSRAELEKRRGFNPVTPHPNPLSESEGITSESRLEHTQNGH